MFIAKVQEWLGHANGSTTRLYDRRKSKPEDSPTLHVKYEVSCITMENAMTEFASTDSYHRFVQTVKLKTRLSIAAATRCSILVLSGLSVSAGPSQGKSPRQDGNSGSQARLVTMCHFIFYMTEGFVQESLGSVHEFLNGFGAYCANKVPVGSIQT